MKKTSAANNVALFNFGTPALRSVTGLITCPNAGLCAVDCYARQGSFNYPNVKNAYEQRLEISLTADFVPLMNNEIRFERIRNKGKQVIIRIHDSADYYSEAYFDKWLTIMRDNPDVQFYAYSKMVSLHKRTELPSNYTVIFSLGGKEDNLIDLDNDRHSRVFESLELFGSGYVNASNDDLMAISSLSTKIGLVYHGVRKYANTTWRKVMA